MNSSIRDLESLDGCQEPFDCKNMVCRCSHAQRDHDRRLDINILRDDYYYPCKDCDCDSFEIDEVTRKKIAVITNAQWQRLRDQTEVSMTAMFGMTPHRAFSYITDSLDQQQKLGRSNEEVVLRQKVPLKGEIDERSTS